MKQLLSKARARVIRHLVLDKGALALTVGLGAFLLLLLIGTQVLDWYWPVLIAAASLGVGVYQLRKNIPSTYEVAQRIDHRLELADSLSTAVYFSEHPKAGFEAICASQYRAAEQLATGVNLPQALPMPRSRYLLPAAALLLAAAGLFGVRYFMIGSLDMQSSLLEAVTDTFFSSQPEELAAKNARKDPKSGNFDPSQALQPESAEEEKGALPPEFEKGDKFAPGKENQQQNSAGDEKSPGQSDEQNEGDQQGDQNPSPQDKQGDRGRDGDQNEAQPQGQDQRSFMDKIRDAMNNVMNKMSPNNAKQGPQKGGEKQKGQKQDKSGKGDDSQNSDDAQADNNQDGSDGKQPDSKQAANAPGQKPSDQAASGSGENDGKKDIEQAKMLEAMGKLNELIGERSNQITGDMTVEVGSSTQQLKTAMTQQKAGHTDAGGEIHRDQVPLADQLFVEQYFKEVRKAGTSGTASGAAKGKGAAAKQ